jgi:tRNA A37 threonylcarbamoyladenosine dehydratase
VDLFDLQDDIAANLHSEVSIHLDNKLGKSQLDFGTENIDAYNAYLQGRHESLKFTGNAADKMASDDFSSILDAIDKIITGVLRFPNEPTPAGASADRWWAAGFSVDDGVSGKIDALA